MPDHRELPLVSAVIPVYNGEAFLGDAIGSVVAQTYPRMECIVVDDGSSDGSVEVARAFGDAVRLIEKANGGVASARNLGAANASGSLIGFLDADDLWDPEKVERQVATMLARPEVGLVYTALTLIDSTGAVVGRMAAPPSAGALRNTLLMEPPVISVAQSALIRRAAFASARGFDESLSTSADCDLACRIALAYPVAGLEDPLTSYRLHAGQMHQGVDALEHDMRIVHHRIFGDARLPPEIRRQRRRGKANLYYTIGGTYRRRRRYGKMTWYLGRALAADPRRVSALRRASESANPRRVVFFTPGHSEVGGAARRSQLIAAGLVERGWQVRVVARAGTLQRPRVAREGNLTVVEVPGFGKRKTGAALFLLCGLVLGLWWGRRASAFLALQLSSPSTAAAVCGRLLRRPYIALSSTSGTLSEVDWVLSVRTAWLRRALLYRAAFLVAQTPVGASELLRLTSPERVATIPNPVPLVPPAPLTGVPNAVYSGRFSEEKDLTGLLRAWRHLVAHIPEAKLSLVGSGGAYRSVESELRGMVAGDPRLSGSVSFVGWVHDVGAILQDADVYVFPSLSEGMSNALLEACAWRRVVVASDIPANRAVLGDDHPLLYRAGDPQALAAALERAFTDESARRIAVARLDSWLPERTVQAVAARFEDLIIRAAAS